MIDRSIFLHPPSGEGGPPVPPELAHRVKKARELLERALAPNMKTRERNDLIHGEARNSAAIEGEFDQDRISPRQGLGRIPGRAPEGEEHAQDAPGDDESTAPRPAGRYRTVQVTVGTYRPPAPALVPSFMEELWEYAGTETAAPLVQAAWTQMQFETVHPFADGNGRTGRALISRILEGPLPLSRYILERRREYYGLLNSGDWIQWLAWFTQGVQEEAARVLEERQEGTRG